MITYVDLYFPAGEVSARDVAERTRAQLGLSFIRGTHDLVFTWKEFDEFAKMVDRIHEVLQGTGVMYHFHTVEEEKETPNAFVGWPPVRLERHWPGNDPEEPPHPLHSTGTSERGRP